MRNKALIKNLAGVCAVVLIVVIFLAIREKDSSDSATESNTVKATIGTLTFDSETIVFDGKGTLNLLEGVHADDGNGNDVTKDISTVITAAGTQTRKIVRYTFNDANGRIISKTRTLVMENYTGPSIFVKDGLNLTAEELKDIINVLYDRDELWAKDGYGKDISGSVTCVREHIADEKYNITFTASNDYLDSVKTVVTANISGVVKDPVIKLCYETVIVEKGEEFAPLQMVASVTNGSASNIKIDSNVNEFVPGNYRVIYTLYSPDGTAKTSETLYVNVVD